MIEFRTSWRRRGDYAADDVRAYEDIYRASPIRHLDSFYLWALEVARPEPHHRLLDVSCGVGRLVSLASRRGLSAIGVDFAHEALVAGNRTARGRFATCDAQSLPFSDDSFDRVINLGSLEHYESPAQGVREMARILKPDGVAAILLPNGFSLLHVIYVWRRGRVFDDGQPLQRYGTWSDWRRLLDENGLRVVDTIKHQRPRPYTIKDALWYLQRPGKLLQVVAQPFLPRHAAGFWVFICKKASEQSVNLPEEGIAPPLARK